MVTTLPPADRTIDLADGRRLAFDDRGDPGGTPVLYMHGTPDTRLGRHPDDSIAEARGIRVIAPDRPGVGSSDGDPGATPASVATDHAALLDALAIDSTHVAAWSAGSIHALALAGSRPDRVRSLSLIAPLVPADAYDDERVLDGADDSRRLFAEHLGSVEPAELGRELAPWLVPPDLDEATAKAMLAESIDRLEQTPGAAAALISSFTGSVAAGMTGIEREIAAQATPLGSLLDTVACRVAIHAGTEDSVTPPAMARWLADRLAARVMTHRAGHEIGITAWDRILDDLAG